MSTKESDNVKVRLGNRFHRLFGATLVSAIGTGMHAAALPLLALRSTSSPVALGFVTVAARSETGPAHTPPRVVADLEHLRIACCRAKSMKRAGAVDDDGAATAFSADHGASTDFAGTLHWRLLQPGR
ncbi:hypothetical protein ATK36_0527 [Amycolatopsis sulphurea]|uniref:Uncharacterized protein n=1 Tax=Amycolatopsis sulphurea TaxID=76022 RepID=A0A2A9G293_9PSEU|nr:hypothetical protein [Amycolatopsis sulphurea]PFG56982.1 hypothetical protein ATK36_0527 [Amycolatopsis sulphurea]